MITFLDENSDEYGALSSIKVTNAVNGERSVSGTIYTNEAVLERVDKGWRLQFDDEYYTIIYAKPIDIGDQTQVSFDAVHQFFYDFDKSSVYSQLKDGSHTFEEYLRFIFDGSGYSYRLEVGVKAFEKQSFGFKSRLTLFNDVIKSAGVEFSVSGKVVRILEKVGTDLSTIVRKHFNMNELTIEKNIGDFITYKKGFGAYVDEEDHSKGRLEVEYESPLAKVYGRLEGEPLVDERYSVKTNLLSALKKAVDESYTISVQIDMEDLTKAGYSYTQPIAGDYIMAINETLHFQEKIRIVSFTSEYDVAGNLLSHAVTCNDLGTAQKQSTAYSSLSKKVNNQQASAENALAVANLALISADGKNRNYYGSSMPEDLPKGTLKKGDILYLTVGDQVKMYFWNGADWIIFPYSEDIDTVKNEIEGLKAESARYEQEFMQGLQDATVNAEANAQAMRANLEAQIADETQAIKDKQAQFEAGMNQDRTKLTDLTQKVGTLSSQQTADKQSLSREIASAKSSVASVASDLATAKTSLNNAVTQANTKATSLEQSLTQTSQTVEQQGRDLVTQASAQAELRTLTSEVKKLADGTQTTLNELSKTVNKATRDITSVTNRTKVVEDGLVGVNNRYTETTIKIHAQTGQITALNAKTAQLESGLSGIKEKFENIKIGSRNYFSQYLANYDTSGTYAIRLVSETQPITITVTDNDTSVDVSGCYFGLLKDKFAKQDAQWLLSNGTLNNAKKTITGWPILAVYPKNQATLDKIFSRYKVMVEIGNISTDWVLAEEDFRHELATYVRNASENSAELVKRIEIADGKAVEAKTYAQQTAEGFKSRIESLESYKESEGTRAEQYLSASRTETAKQLSAERTAIANNYVAKSAYTEDVRGTTQKLTEIKSTADTTKQNLATYQNTVDRKLTELTSTTQTLDGKINTANTKVDTVAGQIRTEISEVEGKIPTSVSHRNLIPNTFDSWSAYQSITSSTNWVTSLGTVKYGDVSIYAGSKVHLYVHVSANDIVFDPNVTNHTMAIQGRILDSQNALTWTDWNLYHPFYNKWSSNLNTGLNYRLIKLTATVTQEMYQHSKGFELQVRIDGVKTGNFHIKSLMVTTGDIFPENWSPAPEDINSELSSTKTLITQTAEGQTQLSNRLTTTQDKISTAETKINQLIGDISTKVSKTDYDRLTNRVSNAETTIRTQAGQIEQRLTSTQVESAITAKGYQTKADVDNNIAGRGFATTTTLENKITETVSGYTREISRVEGLISTETSGNILLASNVGVTNAHSSFLTLAEPIVKGKTYTVVQHWWRSGTNASKGVPLYCIDRSMSADGTTQYANMYYDSTIDSWTATFVSTVNVAKGTRIRFANSDYKNGPFGSSYDSTGSWAFTTLVAGKTPLSSWQPHWSEQATVTALNAVKSTADEHTRTLTSLQNDTLKKAEVSITSDKIVLGVGKEINGRTFSTMIAQDSQNVAIIAKLMKVSSDMIVDGTITAKDLAAGSVTAAQILANAVTTEKLASNAVTADKLLADQALFNKLKANQAYLKTLFTTDAFAQTVKTIDLVADKITTGTLNGANVNLINLNASNITSGRLSANLISGGVLSSLNNSVYFDLNNSKLDFNQNATIEFKSASNAIFRKRNVHTAFLHFQDTTLGGIPSVYASLGVTRGNHGINSASSGRFAGIRIFSTSATADPNGSAEALHEAKADQIELYGDKIILTHGFGGNAITLRASQLDKNYDLLSWMQAVKKAIKSLSNIWSHANNVNWDFVNSNDLRRAVYNELNSFGWGDGL